MTCDISYEALAAFVAGDSSDLAEHVGTCRACRERIAALGSVDAALLRLSRREPSPEAMLKVRRELAREVRPDAGTPEVMTLDEVAAYLRISSDALGNLLENLPAFELDGQLRVRRERLDTWIAARESDYMRRSLSRRMTRTPVSNDRKGVA